MTTLLDRFVSGTERVDVLPARSIGTPRLLAGLGDHAALDFRAHLAVHGLRQNIDLAPLLTMLEDSALRGRGGAGFPLAKKIRALRGSRPTVVVNGSEGEPGSRKDATLLQRSPHLVLDGALTVAAAIGASAVTIAVHEARSASAMNRAIAARPDAEKVRVQTIDGGFVAGEARAVVRALGGGPAIPPGRREHAADRGILLANVETFAQTAILGRLGVHEFASVGTADEPGTTLLTVGGAVRDSGVLEIPIGIALGEVLDAAGASSDIAAVITGGYHGIWITPQAQVAVSRRGLAVAGGMLGAGVVVVLGNDTCALGELARVARWLAGESARQCGPCMFGLPALADDVYALYRGDASAVRVAARHASAVAGRGACQHPDGAVRFITSGLQLLKSEVERHRHGGCGRPVLGQLPIGAHR